MSTTAGSGGPDAFGEEHFGEEYWEGRYRHGHAGARTAADGGAEPNPHLVAEVDGLVPGTALDAGCGEGAEARWLAARGWRVTAVDIAATALRHARERSGTGGSGVAGRIDWLRADLTAWTPPGEGFDLVWTSYVHSVVPSGTLFRRLAAAVAPGGTLLVVGHHPSHPRHAPSPRAYVLAEEVAAGLDADRWDVVVAEARTRSVTGDDGRGIALCDTVLRARRRS